jgi:2-dehydropantoate 2-reductase
VITVQNGMDPQERLQAILGRDHVMGGTTYIIGAKVASPGVIAHVGSMERLIFGEFDGSKSERAQQFLTICKKANIDGVLSTDIAKDMWAKFALLSAFSGVTSMVRKPVGAIMNDPDTRKLLGDAIAETAAVAAAKGVDLGADYVEKHRNFYASVSPNTKSSMQMDLENGRRLELDWLSGAVARFGGQFDVPTPIHRVIYAALKLYANGRG